MKNTILFTVAHLLCTTLMAQAPQGIGHQAEPNTGQTGIIAHNPGPETLNQQPLEQLLNPDGAPNLGDGIDGSIDPTGNRSFTGNSKSSAEQQMDTVADIDGNIYTPVKIGDQWWLKENMKSTRYRNGDVIPNFLDEIEPDDRSYIIYPYVDLKEGKYVIYPHTGGITEDNVVGISSEQAMLEAYGILYNWYATTDPRGLCPAGWRVPNDDDWHILEGFADSQYDAGDPIWDSAPRGYDAGEKLKSCRQVNSPLGGLCNTSEHPRWNSLALYNGVDEFGFSALPGGRGNFRMFGDTLKGLFSHVGTNTFFWTATESCCCSAYDRRMAMAGSVVYRLPNPKTRFYSVRCILGPATEPGVPDTREIDGQTIGDTETECFDALQTITVSDFLVEAGGSATFIAGQSILLLPGTTVIQGGFLLARIAANEHDFCGSAKATAIAEETYAFEEDMVSADLPHIDLEADLFKVYPNPTTGEFTLELHDFEQASSVLAEIYSMQGHLVARKELPPQQQHSLSLFQQQPGVYLLRVVNNNKTGSVKIIRR